MQGLWRSACFMARGSVADPFPRDQPVSFLPDLARVKSGSARPALGGRFSPAGSGAGLCLSRTCRSAVHRPARAGETRVAFPAPARWDDSTLTAEMAGAIAPAKAPRCPLPSRGPKAPGQRPPRPWRALRPRRAGRWPLSFPDLPVCRGPSCAGGGKRGSRFLFPAEGAIPFHGPGSVSRPANRRIAVSAPVNAASARCRRQITPARGRACQSLRTAQRDV